MATTLGQHLEWPLPMQQRREARTTTGPGRGSDAFGKLDSFTAEGNPEIVQTDQIRTSVKWSIEMCDFLAANLALCARLLNAACETNYTEETMKTMGKRIWTLARIFNVREGFSKKDDTIPPECT